MAGGEVPVATAASTETEPAAASRSRPMLVWGLSFLVFSVLSIAWALASPVFSVPDEVAHSVKAIGQLQGQVVGRTVDGVRHLVVDLEPEDAYRGEMLCFVEEGTVYAG